MSSPDRRTRESTKSRFTDLDQRRRAAWSWTRIGLLPCVIGGLWGAGWWYTQSTGNKTKVFAPGDPFPWLVVGIFVLVGLYFLLSHALGAWREYLEAKKRAKAPPRR